MQLAFATATTSFAMAAEPSEFSWMPSSANGLGLGALGAARAEQPALDRALVERLVRAQEEQNKALDEQTKQLAAIARAVERDGQGATRALEGITRAVARCKK